jgi:glycosyltransferase involved in cell wall biosynthesis
MARKNPEAVLEAFQTAFPDPDTPVVMVFKSMIRQASPFDRKAFNTFKAIAQKDPRIILIEETLSRDENASLYMRCDAYVSLHRAEGFGLTMAEAMGYGKPTIGTGYSGNLDFMNSDNSCLVKFTKVEMDPALYHGQQREWAEPNTDDAARHMRRIFEDVRFRETIARAGKRTIYEEFSNYSVGQKLLTRIQEIYEARS